MSFRIDIARKGNVMIYLVVVRDQITINFEPEDPAYQYDVIDLYSRFSFLYSNMVLNNKVRFVRGEDSEHIKRHHVYAEEIKVSHEHISFNQEVTPAIFSEFFAEMLRIQKLYPDHNYQFCDQATAAHAVHAFNAYYEEFTNSSLQQQFLEKRELTRAEKISLASRAVLENGTLSENDKRELAADGIQPPQVLHRPRPLLSVFGQLLFLLSFSDKEEVEDEELVVEDQENISVKI